MSYRNPPMWSLTPELSEFFEKNPPLREFVEVSRLRVGDYFDSEAGVILFTIDKFYRMEGEMTGFIKILEFIFDFAIKYYKRFYEEYWCPELVKLREYQWKIRLGLSE